MTRETEKGTPQKANRRRAIGVNRCFDGNEWSVIVLVNYNDWFLSI